MSQSYEPCFSFSVPPGKPCDPAYADPAPILLSRNASCKRRTDTAISNTSDEGASATSPFAFSVPSEPSSSYRHSFPGPGYSPGSSSAPDYPVRQTHHSHPPAAPLPHHEPRQVISKSIGPRNNHVPPPPPHPCPPPPFLFHSLNERQGQEPFCLGPAPPRKRPRRRFEEIERLYACTYTGCTKAYGTLNHLNAHVTMQKHGLKRLPQEFKDVRKEWRSRKKQQGDGESSQAGTGDERTPRSPAKRPRARSEQTSS